MSTNMLLQRHVPLIHLPMSIAQFFSIERRVPNPIYGSSSVAYHNRWTVNALRILTALLVCAKAIFTALPGSDILLSIRRKPRRDGVMVSLLQTSCSCVHITSRSGETANASVVRNRQELKGQPPCLQLTCTYSSVSEIPTFIVNIAS